MTTKFKILLLFLAMAVYLLCFSSCQKEDEDPCKATQWEQSVNYSVQPKLKPFDSELPDGYNLKDAKELKFEGLIHKVHCGGTLGTQFDYQSFHDPRGIDDEYWKNGFYVGKVYGFDFDNDEDFLECGFTLTATFEDGNIYYLSLQSVKVKPPFILDWDRSYFFLTVEFWMNWTKLSKTS